MTDTAVMINGPKDGMEMELGDHAGVLNSGIIYFPFFTPASLLLQNELYEIMKRVEYRAQWAYNYWSRDDQGRIRFFFTGIH